MVFTQHLTEIVFDCGPDWTEGTSWQIIYETKFGFCCWLCNKLEIWEHSESKAPELVSSVSCFIIHLIFILVAGSD